MDSSETAQPEAELAAKVADADAVVLVWDTTRPLTLEHCETFWLPYLAARTDSPVVLVGNKVDDDGDSNIDPHRNRRQSQNPGEGDSSDDDDDESIRDSEEVSSSESAAERLEAVAAVVAQFRAQIVACFQCSAKMHTGVAEVFFAAQHAVAHPVSPLVDLATGKLTLRAAAALRRVFRYFDRDCDGVLSLADNSLRRAAGSLSGEIDDVSELQRFQMDCFSAPLRSSELHALAQLVARHTQGKGLGHTHCSGSNSGGSDSSGIASRNRGSNTSAGEDGRVPPIDASSATEWSVHETGINAEGFLALFEQLAGQQRWDAAWVVLRRFGYDLHHFDNHSSSSSSSGGGGTMDDFVGEIALTSEARVHSAYLPPKPAHLPGKKPSHHDKSSSLRLGLSSEAEAFLTRVFRQYSKVSKQQPASSLPSSSRLNDGDGGVGSPNETTESTGYLTTKALAAIFSAVPGYGHGDEEVETMDESSDTSGVDSDNNTGGAPGAAPAAAGLDTRRSAVRMVEASAPWDCTGERRKGLRQMLLWAPQAGVLPNPAMASLSSTQRLRRGRGGARSGDFSRSSSGTLTPSTSRDYLIDRSSPSSLQPPLSPSPSAASTSPEGAPPQIAHSRLLAGSGSTDAEEGNNNDVDDDDDDDDDGDGDGERVGLEAWLGAWRASALLDPPCTAKHLTYLGYCAGPFDKATGAPAVAPLGLSNAAGSSNDSDLSAAHSFVPPVVWCPSPAVGWAQRAQLRSGNSSSSNVYSDDSDGLFGSATVVHALVLGSAGSGKTALLRRLCAPTYENAPPPAVDSHRRPWSSFCAIPLRPEDLPAQDHPTGAPSTSKSGSTTLAGGVGIGARSGAGGGAAAAAATATGEGTRSRPPHAVLVLTEGSGIEAQHMCSTPSRHVDGSEASSSSLLGESGIPVDVVLLCFDSSDPNSLAYALDLESRLSPSLPRLLVGTKEDLCPMPLPSDGEPRSHAYGNHVENSSNSSNSGNAANRANGSADSRASTGTAHGIVGANSGLNRTTTSTRGVPGTWALAQRHCVARELPLPLPTSSASRRNTEASMPGSLARRAVHAALEPATAQPMQRSVAAARIAQRRWQRYLVAGTTGAAALAAVSALILQQQGELFKLGNNSWPSLASAWQIFLQSKSLHSFFGVVARFHPKRLAQKS